MLREFLGQVNDRTFFPEERRSIIVSQLLPNQEPVKLFALASLLGVTDGTISNDLDKLEGWFKGHGLKLVRKPGLVNHLGPSISRLKMGMPIRNPLLGEMNQEYPELMQLAAGYTEISVTNAAIGNIPKEAQIVVTHEKLAQRAIEDSPQAEQLAEVLSGNCSCVPAMR